MTIRSLKKLGRVLSVFLQPPYTRKKIATLVLVVITLPLFLILAVFAFVILGLTGPLPSTEELRQIENPIASEVFSSDSVLLGRFFWQERSPVSFEQIPKATLEALVAIEDERFFSHRGVDYPSLGRVLLKTILLGSETGGGSTLTQQLAKNLFPRKDYWILSMPFNKAREIVIARRLETIYSKNEILSLYLNTVPFGENIFGIEAAAQRFFSRPTRLLTIDQSAMLVGMLKATHSYNPRLFPERALTRRNVVLAQMARQGIITIPERDSIAKIPLKLAYNKITHHSGVASYFREQVRLEVASWLKKYNQENNTHLNMYTSGLRIYTTLHARMQVIAEEVVADHLSTLQRQLESQGTSKKIWDRNPSTLEYFIKNSSRYQQLARAGLPHDKIMAFLKEPVATEVFSYAGPQQVSISPIDSIKHHSSFLNTGMIALDPEDGSIRVWVGGIDHRFFQYDHVKVSTKRQVGSTFKPLVFAAALERGVKPCSFIPAERTVYTNVDGWSPKNSGNDNYELKYSMKGALAYSVNTVAVKMLEEAGIERTIELAHQLGIKSDLEPVPSLALGAADISLSEMATAYASFANGGRTVDPFMITTIVARDGTILKPFRPKEPTRVITSETAALITDMLRAAAREGTSAALTTQYRLRSDIGGKTGTTQSNTDGWFIGTTPRLVLGVWVGGDHPQVRFQSTALGQGARTALPIAGRFLQRIEAENKFSDIVRARFAPLPTRWARKLDCALYKEDRNWVRKLSGRTEQHRDFGAPKKSLWKRLWSRKW